MAEMIKEYKERIASVCYALECTLSFHTCGHANDLGAQDIDGRVEDGEKTWKEIGLSPRIDHTTGIAMIQKEENMLQLRLIIIIDDIARDQKRFA